MMMHVVVIKYVHTNCKRIKEMLTEFWCLKFLVNTGAMRRKWKDVNIKIYFMGKPCSDPCVDHRSKKPLDLYLLL